MSKPNNRVATVLVLLLILPFAAGIVHAQEPAKPAAKAAEKQVPPPTIDSNQDGKADAWDRDANGMADAWDINDDGKPDLFDDNGDGKPDDGKAPPPAQPEGDRPR